MSRKIACANCGILIRQCVLDDPSSPSGWIHDHPVRPYVECPVVLVADPGYDSGA